MTTNSDYRAPVSNHVVIRAADEGIPIRAICRILRRPFDDVQDVVSNARDAGHLISVPAVDWPIGARREDRLPTGKPSRPTDVDGICDELMGAFQLTKSESRLVAALMRHGNVVGKATLHTAIADHGLPASNPKIVDVFVCKARKKLSPFGIEIDTVWGRGYSMGPDAIAAIRGRLPSASELTGVAAA